MVELAIWIIAICEIVRMFQNEKQIAITRHAAMVRDNMYDDFIESLKQDDKEFVRRMLEEYEKKENNDDIADEQDS